MNDEQIKYEIDLTRKKIMDELINKDPIAVRNAIREIKRLDKLLYKNT